MHKTSRVSSGERVARSTRRNAVSGIASLTGVKRQRAIKVAPSILLVEFGHLVDEVRAGEVAAIPNANCSPDTRGRP